MPIWYVAKAARYASVVMYTNVNAGHRQLPLSRRMMTSVEAHCAHNAKNTMIDIATGIL